MNAPMAILKQDGQYPIYAVDVHQEKEVFAVAGGMDCGFIGTLLYLYNYKQQQTEVKKEDRISPEKQKQSGSETKEEPSQEQQEQQEHGETQEETSHDAST